MKKIIASIGLVIGLLVGINGHVVAKIPSRPSLVVACIDKTAAKMLFDIAREGNPGPNPTAQAIFASGSCKPFPMVGLKDELFNDLVKLTDTVLDWEGDPMAMFQYHNPVKDQDYFMIIYNPDIPNNDGKPTGGI